MRLVVRVFLFTASLASTPHGSTGAEVQDELREHHGASGNTFDVDIDGTRNSSPVARTLDGGSLLWKTQCSNVSNFDDGVTLGVVWSSPLLIGSAVFIGSRDGFIYALNRTTGEFVWKKDTAGYIDSSPR